MAPANIVHFRGFLAKIFENVGNDIATLVSAAHRDGNQWPGAPGFVAVAAAGTASGGDLAHHVAKLSRPLRRYGRDFFHGDGYLRAQSRAQAVHDGIFGRRAKAFTRDDLDPRQHKTFLDDPERGDAPEVADHVDEPRNTGQTLPSGSMTITATSDSGISVGRTRRLSTAPHRDLD